MRKLLLGAGLFALAFVASGASAPNSGSAVASVDTVDVSPNLDTLFGAEQFSLSARTVDSVGRTLNRKITWTVRNTALFKSVKKTGDYDQNVKAFAKGDSGRTYVVATAGSKKDSALIIVRDTTCSATTLGSLNLGLDSTVMRRTDTIAAVALPRTQCGALMSGVDVTWASSDTAGGASITRVDSLIGRIVSVDSTGTTYIKAINGTVRDSIKIKHKGNL